MKPLCQPIFGTRYSRRVFCLAVAAGFASLVALNVRASTYVWNNTANAWETVGAFSVGGTAATGVPTATDTVSFDPTIANAAGVIFNPAINAADAALSINLTNSYLGGNYGFTGSGSLTVGGSGSTGLTVRGFGTQSINIGSGTGNSLSTTGTAGNLNVGYDAGLTLTGNTVAAFGTRTVNLQGTLTLDNSGGNPALQRLTSSAAVNFNGTGANLVLNGASGGTNFTGLSGAVSFNAGDGAITIVEPAGATAATTATFGSLTRTAGMTINFINGGIGTLGGGGATDPSIKFTTAPTVTNGVIATASGGSTLGYATVNGTDFAGYTPSGGVVAVSTTAVSGTLTTASAQNSNLTGNASIATGTTITYNTLKISPSAAGQSLAITGTGALSTAGIILAGTTDYSITGGSMSAAVTKQLYVSNVTTTLALSSTFGASANPVSKSGAGILALTGTADQFAFSTAQNINLNGGVLRAAIGTNLGTSNILRFRGGVLEISNGATFSRSLGTSTGNVGWDSGSAGGGSGGFSAYGSAAAVNIGGSSTALTWGQTNFVQDGSALLFGSSKSNAVLTFQNPLGLDAGTAGLPYTAREINVTLGSTTVANGAVLAGSISGSASADLLKTGTGSLSLATTNTYTGRTIIEGGTLVAAGAGLRTLSSTSGVIAAAGGTLQMGFGNQFNPDSPAPVTLNGSSSAAATFSVNGYNQGNATNAGVGALTLANGSSNNVLDFGQKAGVVSFVSFGSNGAVLTVNNYIGDGTSGGTDRLIFSSNQSNNLDFFNFGAGTGAQYVGQTNLGGGFYEIYSLVPVPEPATFLGGALAVVALGWNQRRRVSGLVGLRRKACAA